MAGGLLALSGGGPRSRATKSSPAAHPLPCLRRTVTSASVLDPCCPTVAGPWSSPVAPHALRRARPRRHGRMLWACIAANPRHAAGELSWPLCLYALSSSSCIVAGRFAISVLIDGTTYSQIAAFALRYCKPKTPARIPLLLDVVEIAWLFGEVHRELKLTLSCSERVNKEVENCRRS